MTRIRQLRLKSRELVAGSSNQIHELPGDQVSESQGMLRSINNIIFALISYASSSLRNFENIVCRIDKDLSSFGTKRLIKRAVGLSPFVDMNSANQENCVVVFTSGYQNFEGNDKTSLFFLSSSFYLPCYCQGLCSLTAACPFGRRQLERYFR